MSQPFGPGSTLKNRYRIERELGRGGVGVVYLARDERLHGMPVVIKFLLDAAGQNAWLTRKFLQEAEALTRINHPGVVRVIDRDESEDGRPFFVMEFIEGRPLRAVMGVEGMALAEVARIARQIGHALHAAHQQGVFHRDLKPENIMLQQLGSGEEQVKLIDFGIAKVVNPQEGNETEVVVVAGSRQYIAPEQLLSQMISPATDIYAMAIIVYEMVTGRRPFNPQGPNHFLAMQQLAQLQQTESFARPQTFRPDLPAAAQMLMLGALAFDPRRRPQDARIFAEDLARALTGQIKVAEERRTAAAPEAFADEMATDVLPAASTARVAVPASMTTELPPASPSPNASRRGKLPIVVGMIVVALIAAVVIGKSLLPSLTTNPNETDARAVTTERLLNYSVTMQKDPRRYPGSAPFRLPGEVVFSPGDRVLFDFSSPQSGHLYVINESPVAAGQSSSFNILFPSPTANRGSAQLAAGQSIRVPEIGEGFEFDEEQGAEKLWLIWAAAPVPELEAVKGWANPQDLGEIKDAARIAALRDFLNRASSAKPDVERDETNKQTTVKAKGDVLVRLVNLQHY